MADAIPAEEQAAPSSESPKKGRRKMIVIIAALMVAEGVVLFLAINMLSPKPDPTLAEGMGEEDEDDAKLNQFVEVVLSEVQASNRKAGRPYVYHFQLSALIPAEHKERVEKFVAARQMLINDRVQTVIRAADPKDLNEPSLETIKRQLMFEIRQLMGDEEGMIKEVLIPKLLQSRGSL